MQHTPRPGSLLHRTRRRAGRRARRGVHEAGMATAEYAIGLLAATGFALLLVAILHGSAVKALLMSIVTKALSVGG